MSKHPFPPGFLWGFATSAHQIEGAFDVDGRGESIWDRFANTPGKIADGTTAAVACDHYRRWPEDVALMRSLGANAYRFSVAWPRVLPKGRGAVNAKGLDFYDRLVDGVLAQGLRPFLTLYHWDLPQALQEEGGWAARSTTEAFAEYADVVSRRLGDRVKDWTTHNEPWCIATLGHDVGEQAPGHKDPAESLAVAHHVLLSHGMAVPILRQNSPGARVGIVLILVPGRAASPSDADREALRKFDGEFNRWYLDPLFRGTYPADAVEDRIKAGHLTASPEWLKAGDLQVIAAPLDYLGLNFYSPNTIRSATIPESENAPRTRPIPAPETLTDMGWPVDPSGLHEILTRVTREYGPKAIFITENGAAYSDGPDANGRIADVRRREYIRGHLLAAQRAIADGVPLGGYFLWSFLDNFEWAHGFRKRFGAVWVDYETQQRIPKDSAYFYRDVALANAIDDA